MFTCDPPFKHFQHIYQLNTFKALTMAPKTSEKKPVVAAKAAKKPVAKKGGKKGSTKGVESWKVRMSQARSCRAHS